MQGLVSQKPESLEDDDGDDIHSDDGDDVHSDDGDDVQKWRLSLVKTMEMSDSDAHADLFLNWGSQHS